MNLLFYLFDVRCHYFPGFHIKC